MELILTAAAKKRLFIPIAVAAIVTSCAWFPSAQDVFDKCTAGIDPLVGKSYPSQKIEFADPVSGNEVWRLTTDGAQHAVLHSFQDQSGRETYQWSPDGTKLCYAKTGHPDKPNGIYIIDIFSGVETYFGPGSRTGACAFGNTANELFVQYGEKTETARWSEIRRYSISSLDCRVIRKFRKGSVGQLSLNTDGTYMGVHLITSPPDVNYGDDEFTFEYVIVNIQDGSLHPNWRLDGTADELANGGAFYWHQSNPDYVRALRDGERNIWNIHTLEKIPARSMTMVGTNKIPPGHGCWSADGRVWFRSNGHPDCHPQDYGTGLDTRIIIERLGALYLSEIRNFLVSPNDLRTVERPPPGDPDALLVLTYGANATHLGHPHTQFSDDGKYVAFVSDMGNTSAGTPPGGVDRGPFTTDIFVAVIP